MPTSSDEVICSSALWGGGPPTREVGTRLWANRIHLSQAVADWLGNLAPWTFAVTFTIKRHDAQGNKVNQFTVVSAARHFLALLNVSCFGASKARRHHTVGSAVSFGWGSYGDHPHLHLSLAAPADMHSEKFLELIEKAALRTYWIHRQQDIQSYRNQGWMYYMVGHGADNVLLSLVRRPNPDNEVGTASGR